MLYFSTVAQSLAYPSDKNFLQCTSNLPPAQLFSSTVNICISPVCKSSSQYHKARCPFWLQAWSCRSSLTHSFTSPLLHYLWVRVNNRMSECARALECAIMQKREQLLPKLPAQSKALTDANLSAEGWIRGKRYRSTERPEVDAIRWDSRGRSSVRCQKGKYEKVIVRRKWGAIESEGAGEKFRKKDTKITEGSQDKLILRNSVLIVQTK